MDLDSHKELAEYRGLSIHSENRRTIMLRLDERDRADARAFKVYLYKLAALAAVFLTAIHYFN